MRIEEIREAIEALQWLAKRLDHNDYEIDLPHVKLALSVLDSELKREEIGITKERIDELAEADAEGRVVVLPMKPNNAYIAHDGGDGMPCIVLPMKYQDENGNDWDFKNFNGYDYTDSCIELE